MPKPLNTWYKNRTWNGDIDERFEKNLRYTRNPIHKAGYLLEQGSLLLENPNPNIQEVGQVLLAGGLVLIGSLQRHAGDGDAFV